MEAGAFGCVSIVSDLPQIRNVIKHGHNGFIFQSDTGSIAHQNFQDILYDRKKLNFCSKNINIDYLTQSYIALSDINLLNKNLKQADNMIKKALRANKHFPGLRNKLKTINKLKLQGT